MYTILGATGNIGSVITKQLLEKGETVRVVGRNAARLQQYVHRGAEAFVADIKDAEALKCRPVSDSGSEARRASDWLVGDRAFHQKFGYGHVVKIDGSKLTVAFDQSGEKAVVAGFVERAIVAGAA